MEKLARTVSQFRNSANNVNFQSLSFNEFNFSPASVFFVLTHLIVDLNYQVPLKLVAVHPVKMMQHALTSNVDTFICLCRDGFFGRTCDESKRYVLPSLTMLFLYVIKIKICLQESDYFSISQFFGMEEKV